MNKIVVGIVPKIVLNTTDDPYQDIYSFVNNYPKRIYEAGAIPVGLLFNDGKISLEQLELCDAFIIPGGNRIDQGFYQLLAYAKKNNKPVLGICMGMQAISVFSVINDMIDDLDNPESFRIAYEDMKNNNPTLYKLDEDNIHSHQVIRTNVDTARHDVTLDKNSLLAELYNKEVVSGVSLHGIAIKRVGSLMNVVGHTEDDVIEAIENKDLLWLGVQYHPEIDDEDVLINRFIKEIERRS